MGKANKSPKKSSGVGVVTAARPKPEPAPTAEPQPAATPAIAPATTNGPQPVIAKLPNSAETDPVVPQSPSVSTNPKAAQAVARVTGLNAVVPLLPPGPGAPAQLQSLWVMLGVARRPTDDGQSAATIAPAAATTTVPISTWSQLGIEVAKYGGYMSFPTAGPTQNGVPATLDDTSWTLKNTYLGSFDDAYTDDSLVTQTTYTYSTPYSQNPFVQSQLKNRAIELHLTYSASNYTAWLVATSPTDPSAITGGKQLTIGDAIVHPAPIIALAPDGNGGFTLAMPATTDPSWQSSYSVVILPKNIVPVFPGGDITAPKAPTIATSKLTPFSVTLKPSGSTDDVAVVGYNYYRVSSYDDGHGGIFTTIVKANGTAVATGTTFVDTAVEPDTTYVYTARAVDAAGHESLDSPALLVKTPAEDTEPPTAPTITAGTITTTTATLSVSGSTDNVGVDGYDIYRDGLQINVAPIKAGQSFVDTDLTPGTEYAYTAQAFDAAGNYSDESVAILVTTTGSTGGGGGNGGGGEEKPLPVPKLTRSEVTDQSVVLTVSAGATDSRVVSYWIYRDGQLIAQLQNSGESYTDQNLDSDVTYTYTAKAIDAEFAGSGLSRSLTVTTYSTNEWEYLHGKDDSIWEKTWERFNTYFGWIPLIGDGLAAVSLGIDIGQLLNAIASKSKHQIYDEVYDLMGDAIGFIPILPIFKNLDKTLADEIAELDGGRTKKTVQSIAWHAAELIYDKIVRPRIENASAELKAAVKAQIRLTGQPA
ncbi:hypothetical protein ACRDU6_14920 [Mycolicibacterium sp. ELW1]|uniref:hypothetical protein n=1 Tax=Mycobacteriaceae TaxID=1762 RepID=UPI0011EBCECC|nr:hypothetical protein [Mycobacterium sp. ELW1]QEN13785.1 hypothetical protein D3H54_11490 [Mycobacterium sp. ELW1]